MLTEEEIRLKLGLDTKEIDEGTRRALEKIVKFGKESEKAFYEHGERPARAFHKALHELSEQMPILGNAARIALSPIGGTLAIATAAAVHFKKALDELNESMDRISEVNRRGLGNIPAAILRAARGNARDRIRASIETDQLEDPLGERIRTARTAEERQKVLVDILQQRREAEAKVTGYNSNFARRDLLRTQIEKSGATISGAEEQLGGLTSLAESLREGRSLQKDIIDTLRSPKFAGLLSSIPGANLALAGYNFGADQKASLVTSLDATIQNFKKQIEEESKKRTEMQNTLDDEQEKHQEDVRVLQKLTEARKGLLETMRQQTERQKAYDQQISVALRNQTEVRNAPFTPGLQELAGYQGPFARIAQEVLLARNAAKRQAGFANPGELGGLNAEIRGAQFDLGNELRGATTFQGRQAAFRKYGERLQGLLTGRISPEHNLEVIADHIKQLNESAKAEGLIVRGKD